LARCRIEPPQGAVHAAYDQHVADDQGVRFDSGVETYAPAEGDGRKQWMLGDPYPQGDHRENAGYHEADGESTGAWQPSPRRARRTCQSCWIEFDDHGGLFRSRWPWAL